MESEDKVNAINNTELHTVNNLRSEVPKINQSNKQTKQTNNILLSDDHLSYLAHVTIDPPTIVLLHSHFASAPHPLVWR